MLKNFALSLALLLLCGGAGWYLARRHGREGQPQQRVERVERVVVDTLRYEDPAPLSVVAEGSDSLYTFCDTLAGRWSAEVSGSNVELRSLVILEEVEHRTTYQPSQWEVSLKGGVDPYSTWVGVGVTRNYGGVSVSFDGGYNAKTETPYVGVSAAIPLWRKRRR